MDRWQQMRIFVRVVEAGGFSRAAEALGLPKASVSQHLARLEAHLGVRLLQRTTRRLSLTPEGAAYLERARSLLDELDALESSLGRAQQSPRGLLRVDVPAAFARHQLVPALPEFLARYPELCVAVGSSDRPVDLLQEGVDCVVRGGLVHDESLMGRRLRTLAVHTLASSTGLANAKRPAHPEQLREHALIGYFSAKTGQTFAFDFTRGGERIEIDGPWRTAFNDADSYLGATLAGLGIAQIVMAPNVAAHLARGELVRLLPEWEVEPLEQYVLYPSRRHLSARVRVFVDWIVERFGAVDQP